MKQSKGAASYELVPPRTGFPYKARSFKEDNLKNLKLIVLKLWQLIFSVVCVPARLYLFERRLVHTIILSSPPVNLWAKEPFFEKKKEEKIKVWSLKAR